MITTNTLPYTFEGIDMPHFFARAIGAKIIAEREKRDIVIDMDTFLDDFEWSNWKHVCSSPEKITVQRV